MIISIFLGFIGGLLGFKINILLWKQVSKSYVCQIIISTTWIVTDKLFF